MIGVVRTGPDRWSIGQTRGIDDPGGRGDRRAEAHVITVGTGGPLHWHRQVDNRRVERLHALIVEAPPLHDPGSEVARDDRPRRDETNGDLARPRMGHVESEGLLARIATCEVPRPVEIACTFAEWAREAQVVRMHRRLDLDYL